MLSGFGRVIYNVSIVHMAAVFQERVVSASLLTHVSQQEISSAVIDLRIDGEVRRYRIASFEVISSRLFEIAEIQSASTLHVSPFPSVSYGRNGTLQFVCLGIEDLETLNICTFFTHKYGHLDALWQVAQLVDAYPFVGMSGECT